MKRRILPLPPEIAANKNGITFVVSLHDGLCSAINYTSRNEHTIDENIVHLNATKAQ